jgi:hypothetical protein
MTVSTEFSPGGVEHRVSGLVPIGGKLPYCREVQTSKLLDLLLDLNNELSTGGGQSDAMREKANRWLFVRTRPSFYIELNSHLHLAYADQRNGHGSQHWWRLFYDEKLRQKVESVIIDPSDKIIRPPQNSLEEWGGMHFRSKAEICIAKALDRRGVLFFANVRGRISLDGSPVVTAHNGRLEIDFLVFVNGKCISLEVDGKHHNKNGQALRDYARDRLLLREGIPTARFSAQECYEKADAVAEELIALF